MRAEIEQRFAGDQFEPREVDHIGFTRPYFEWHRSFWEGECLRTVDMGLITYDSYDRVSRTPVGDRFSLYNDNGEIKEGLSLEQVFMELKQILE